MNASITERHELNLKIREKFSFLFNTKSVFYFAILLIVICLAFFGMALVTQSFTTPFSGDYAQQAYAFYYNAYDDWWTFFKTGKFPLYDANTFIGADNIEANTYYGLFTPFLVFLLIFPRSFLPHAMVFMTIAKLVTGGLLFRLYLKKMGATESTARIFSIAYAFMGWTCYYLWFSTFSEVVAFLPLILLGIEKVIKDKSIWCIALGFFCIGVGNYFFLLTFGIFGVIYAGFRFFQTLKNRKGIEHLQVIGLGIAGFLIGICLCAVVTFPALFSSFKINRATTSKYLPTLVEALKSGNISQFFKIIFTYWNPRIIQNGYSPKFFYFCYAFPAMSFLYPATSCRYVNILQFNQFENVGSSLFVFTPCILLLLPSFIRSAKNKKWSHFIALALSLLVLFTPFVYWLSGAFANCYGRWEIVISVILITFVALNFDHRDEFKKRDFLISGVITLTLMVGTILLANKLIDLYKMTYDPNPYNPGYNFQYLVGYNEIIGVVIYQFVIVVVETVIFVLLIGHRNKKILPVLINCFLILEVIVQGNVVANYHSLQDIEYDVNTGLYDFEIQSNLIKDIAAKDKSFYRINNTQADEYHSNLGSAENYNGTSTFHSFYNNEVDDFIHMTSLTNWDESWSALNFAKHALIDEFLGTKYFITYDGNTSYISADGRETTVYTPNMPLNFEVKTQYEGYRVYENTKPINFGISYTDLYYKHRSKENPKYNAFYPNSSSYTILRNEEMLFEGAILNDEDLDEIIRDHPTLNAIDDVPTEKAEILNHGAYFGANIYVSRNPQDLYFNPAAPVDDIIPENLLNPELDKDIPVNQYQIVFRGDQPDGTFKIGSEGGYYMLDYPVAQTSGTNYDSAIWLIDTNDKVITFDDARLNSINSGNIYRGFYSKTPIKYIIVCPLQFRDASHPVSYRTWMQIHYLPWETVNNVYDAAIASSPTNVKFSVNDFEFETNYTEERFVCSQLAYTKGWKVKAYVNGKAQNLKVYNAQGGFAGFVAPAGHVTYKMSYVTQDLVLWGAVSTGALLALAALTITPAVIKRKKEKKQAD